jgi:hypothetical protein
MSKSGESDVLVLARSALLDALEALADHAESVVVIGAQAIYLHAGRADVALAEATKDSDLAIDSRTLAGHPLIEEAMGRANFIPNPTSKQPGAWISPTGVPVDLMVPEALAGAAGRRGARIPPHDKGATRRARGLEAAVIDNRRMTIHALAADDSRIAEANVAGPAALLVSKLHKLAEREGDPNRLVDKDAHDVYRLLVAMPTESLAADIQGLLSDPLASDVTHQAIEYLAKLFAAGPRSLGSLMAGRAETAVGDPAVVSASSAALAGDLVDALNSSASVKTSDGSGPVTSFAAVNDSGK